MLSIWLHRLAFAPALLAVLVVAFAFAERPRGIATTLAPDAFSGEGARTLLGELDAAGDGALAVARRRLRAAGFEPALTSGEDGQAVVAERVGREDARLVIVAPVPAGARGTQLSGAAALLELARVFEGRATRRTLTLAVVREGDRGRSALRAFAGRLGDDAGRPVDAVLVLGDLASPVLRRPLVVPWSERDGAAPLRLRRTVEDAVREEAGVEPGAPRALAQVLRLAAPLTVAPQGAFGGRGLPAVTLSAGGERGLVDRAAGELEGVGSERLEGFGRAALRAASALDNGPDVPAGPREELVVARQVVPAWAVRLLAAALLLPLLLAAVDGLARVRRRGAPVRPWLVWVLATALPLLLAALFARVLGLTGLLPAPGGAVLPATVPVEAAGLVAVGLALVLGVLARRVVVRRALPEGLRGAAPAEQPGAAAAVALVLAAVGTAVLLVSATTALVIAPVLHLWLLAAAPEVRSRPLSVALALLGAVPLALVAVAYGALLGLAPPELAWLGVLLLSGGAAGPAGVLATALLLGAGTGALLLALRKGRPEPAAPSPPPDRRRARPARAYSVLEPVSTR